MVSRQGPRRPADQAEGASSDVPRLKSRRLEICTSAAHTFVERGYAATSVNDVAAALGITKAGLYHYISSKEQLLFDIITFSMDSLEEEVIGPTRSIADAEARLREVILRHAMLATINHGTFTLLTEEVPALPPPQRKIITERKRKYFEYVRGMLIELQQDGRLADVDPTVAAFSVLAVIVWTPHWFRAGGRLTGDQLAQEVAAFLMAGLGLGGTRAALRLADPNGEPSAVPAIRRKRLDARSFPKSNARRFKICMTAARTFVERGFEATSVNDIAAALGVTKAGLYHYISSKEALFFEILTLGMDWLDEDVLKHVRGIADPEARLRETITRHALLTSCNPPWITILLDDMKAITPSERQGIERRKREYVEFIRNAIRDLRASGRVIDVDATVAAQATLAMILWLPRWLNPRGRLTPTQAGTQVAGIALRALFSRRTRATRN